MIYIVLVNVKNIYVLYFHCGPFHFKGQLLITFSRIRQNYDKTVNGCIAHNFDSNMSLFILGVNTEHSVNRVQCINHTSIDLGHDVTNDVINLTVKDFFRFV